MHKNEYHTIVVGVAFSPNLKANVFEALRMSVLFNASLVMVHVGEKSAKKEAALQKIISDKLEPRHWTYRFFTSWTRILPLDKVSNRPPGHKKLPLDKTILPLGQGKFSGFFDISWTIYPPTPKYNFFLEVPISRGTKYVFKHVL